MDHLEKLVISVSKHKPEALIDQLIETISSQMRQIMCAHYRKSCCVISVMMAALPSVSSRYTMVGRLSS